MTTPTNKEKSMKKEINWRIESILRYEGNNLKSKIVKLFVYFLETILSQKVKCLIGFHFNVRHGWDTCYYCKKYWWFGDNYKNTKCCGYQPFYNPSHKRFFIKGLKNLPNPPPSHHKDYMFHQELW